MKDHCRTQIKQVGHENYMVKSSDWIELITSCSPISPREKQIRHENYIVKCEQSSDWVKMFKSSSPVTPGEERNGLVIHSMLSLKKQKNRFKQFRKLSGGNRCFQVGVILNSSSYQIIVADAADAVSVNFSGRCKFLQI